MSTDVIVQVVPGGLRCVNGVEADKLDTIMGREVLAKVSQPRNIRFHRKYFALIGAALSLIDEEYTPEQFRALCTVGAGYCDFVEGDKGLVAVPRSISFAQMDDTEFSRLYEDTITFICRRWVVDSVQLGEIARFM